MGRRAYVRGVGQGLLEALGGNKPREQAVPALPGPPGLPEEARLRERCGAHRRAVRLRPAQQDAGLAAHRCRPPRRDSQGHGQRELREVVVRHVAQQEVPRQEELGALGEQQALHAREAHLGHVGLRMRVVTRVRSEVQARPRLGILEDRSLADLDGGQRLVRRYPRSEGSRAWHEKTLRTYRVRITYYVVRSMCVRMYVCMYVRMYMAGEDRAGKARHPLRRREVWRGCMDATPRLGVSGRAPTYVRAYVRSAVQRSAVRSSAMQFSAVQRNALQSNAAHCCAVQYVRTYVGTYVRTEAMDRRAQEVDAAGEAADVPRATYVRTYYQVIL